VLFRDEDSGAIDLAMDPHTPRILYAALWQARRLPWGMSSGGPGSGLFKSADGGDTWTEITHNHGMPGGLLGRIGVTVSMAQPGRVWAMVEAVDGGLFRSDDGGDTWERVSQDASIRQRPFYYYHVIAHPQDRECVWVLNSNAWRSRDGGRTFTSIAAPHVDHHDLWIDPSNPRRMINGNDGGACITYDDGLTWSSLDNQPTAELYGVATDSRDPYWLFASQQDNTSIGLPSRSAGIAITSSEYEEVGGGESGSVAVNFDDPNIIFASSYHGYLTRFDRRSGEMRNVMVWPEPLAGHPAKEASHRFAWHSPVMISPHDSKVIYVGGECIFRSADDGHSWTAISPDLSRAAAHTMEASGGPITRDNVGAEYYATIIALAESPIAEGCLWGGSDDGLVHRSEDGGQTWHDVTPSGLPEFASVSCVEPSHHDPRVAYIAAHAYRLDDFSPYIFKTTDGGRTWSRIDSGIPQDDFTRVIREDPVRPSLLFAGTETGVYVSIDAGLTWEPLRSNLPYVPVHDIQVHGTDLVIATHGRSFWILDDISWLREVSGKILGTRLHIFAPRVGVRYTSNPDLSPLRTVSPVPRLTVGTNYHASGPRTVAFRVAAPGAPPEPLDAGANPPEGVALRYYLKEAATGGARCVVRDEHDHEVISLVGPGAAGLNVIQWDMRYGGAERIPDDLAMASLDRAVLGPKAPPGRYNVQLIVDGRERTTSLEIVKDPRTPATSKDLLEQARFLLQVRDKLTDTHRAIVRLRTVRAEISRWQSRMPAEAAGAQILSAQLISELTSIEDALVQTKARSPQDVLNYPIKLNAKLGGLAPFVAQADSAPSAAAYDVLRELETQIDDQLHRLRDLDGRVAEFSQALERANIPRLSVAEFSSPPRPITSGGQRG
jgi:photosystem II stability/assembly factor-like uncharacterized protein